ncbi:hypothetical protein TL16_g06854 [Triparma laevis f. inornata]|uniref:C3H1-type domain-containing protein n=1 Tax=Triparma laevis f. inornata TaxID=1714386 RepID=A0A9W7AQQ1_9STRA|nr:hypothetical protein TL16_g06854 [Triparma laevis f. inornata]
MPPKKYVLHKTTDGTGKSPCAFFARGECRNGDGCKFSHGEPKPSKKKIAAKKEKKEKEKARGKEKKPAAQKPAQPVSQKRKKEPTQPAKEKKQKQKKPSDDSTPTSALSSLFSTSMFPQAFPNPNKIPQTLLPNPPAAPAPPLPFKPKTDVAKDWHSLVLKTREHPRFNGCLNTLKDVGEGWFKPTPYSELPSNDPRFNSGAMPKMIAMDCEMVETKDPLTGEIDSKSLSRLSVIDGLNPENVLIDTLVKPYWPVSDYRTRINGITKESLEGVEFTLRHAQKFMSDLCSSETVVAGHAIHNDLISLKMEHFRVVDSSFLFKVEGESSAPPSLKDSVKCILNKEMPKTHDSVNDARQAMALIQDFKDEGNKQTKNIIRSAKGGNDTNGPDTLFVHHIPSGTVSEKIKKMFINHTSVHPKKLGSLETTPNGYGKLIVYFSTPELAKTVFEGFKGNVKEDKGGREQKQVFMKSGEYVFVRRNGPTKGRKGGEKGE